ncbi:hypothetical protein [Corynebacterium diphtheriae]|nr:transposase-like protein [Corynebacterium diphtheriae PW8]
MNESAVKAKGTTPAVVALARRRLNVLYAMMRNHEHYHDPAPSQEDLAA